MESVVFLNGEYLHASKALISPNDRGFVYADGVYEVIRFYHGKIFSPQLHVQRLDRSLREISISGVEPAMLIEISERLIAENGFQNADGIIYFQATRGTAPRKHPFPSGISPTVFANASLLERPVEKLATGVKLLLLDDIRWSRCDIKSIALLPNVMASEQAAQSGCYEALFHRDGWITEGSRSNCFIKNGNTWFTHPADRFILNGVTRIELIKLMRNNGLSVVEQAVSIDDLWHAREVFMCSTTSECMPVVEIAGRRIGTGNPGRDSLMIQAELEKQFA